MTQHEVEQQAMRDYLDGKLEWSGWQIILREGLQAYKKEQEKHELTNYLTNYFGLVI